MSYYILLTFKKDPDAKLVLFGADIVARMKGNARYVQEQNQVTIFETAQQGFQQAVNDASDGGHTLIQTRREKRQMLLETLTLLAKQMELHTEEDITFFTETGFEVRKQPSRHLGPLARPVLKYLRQGVKSGSVDGESLHKPKSVVELAVEYSTDNGLTWHNGTYSTGKRFTLENLPVRQDLLIRICYQGTRQRMSDWSASMPVFVL